MEIEEGEGVSVDDDEDEVEVVDGEDDAVDSDETMLGGEEDGGGRVGAVEGEGGC